MSDIKQLDIEDLPKMMTSPPREGSIPMTITPEVAQQVYDRFNIENRPFKATKIALFARDMARGHWGLTGDTIKFSDRGRLRDGQNRLLACVKAGVPFTTHVIFGIDDALFSVMDRGKNRTPGDILAIKGIPNSTTIASAVRWAELIATKTIKRRTSFEPDEIGRLYEENHSGVAHFLPDARIIHGSASMKISPGMIAGLLYSFDAVNPDMAAQFGTYWGSGSPDGRGAPVKKMRDRLITMAGTIGRVHDVVQTAVIVIGWNLFLTGKAGRSTDFDWKLTDDFPKIARDRR